MSEYKTIIPDPGEYRKLITSEILDFNGSIFYEPNFIDIASSIFGYLFKPVILLKDNNVAGIGNFLIGGRWPVRNAAIPPLFQYYGPANFTDDPEVFRYIVKPLENQIDSAVFSLVPDRYELFDIHGWSRVPRLTYLLLTGDYDSMLKNCRQNARRNAHLAEKHGAQFEEVETVPYDIYLKTFSRHGKQPFIDKDKLGNWISRLINENLVKTFIAKIDAKPVAFRTILYYGRFSYFWFNGTLPEYLRSGVSSYLTLKVGEYLHERGIESIDMVGGDLKQIADFKKSFGGKPVKHLQVERCFTLKGRFYRDLMKLRARLNG